MPKRMATVTAPSEVREEVGPMEDPEVPPRARAAAVAARARAVMRGPLVSAWRGLAVSARILTADATQALRASS